MINTIVLFGAGRRAKEILTIGSNRGLITDKTVIILVDKSEEALDFFTKYDSRIITCHGDMLEFLVIKNIKDQIELSSATTLDTQEKQNMLFCILTPDWKANHILQEEILYTFPYCSIFIPHSVEIEALTSVSKTTNDSNQLVCSIYLEDLYLKTLFILLFFRESVQNVFYISENSHLYTVDVENVENFLISFIDKDSGEVIIPQGYQIFDYNGKIDKADCIDRKNPFRVYVLSLNQSIYSDIEFLKSIQFINKSKEIISSENEKIITIIGSGNMILDFCSFLDKDESISYYNFIPSDVPPNFQEKILATNLTKCRLPNMGNQFEHLDRWLLEEKKLIEETNIFYLFSPQARNNIYFHHFLKTLNPESFVIMSSKSIIDGVNPSILTPILSSGLFGHEKYKEILDSGITANAILNTLDTWSQKYRTEKNITEEQGYILV